MTISNDLGISDLADCYFCMNRQLKNRISARECRKKRKEERNGMMDEIVQLRNDKIKLMAEVEVLSKQLQRLEEKERLNKKQESAMQAATDTTSLNVAQDQPKDCHCACSASKGASAAMSESKIQEQIDRAISLKFDAFSSMFDLKVGDMIDNMVKNIQANISEG